MPVQFLPAQQTPLETIMPHVSQATTNILGGLQQRAQNQRELDINKKDLSILDQLQKSQSPMEQWSLIAQLSPEKAKTVSTMATPYFTAQAKSAAKSAEQKAKSEAGVAAMQNAVDAMSTMVKNNAPGIGYSPDAALGLDRQAVQNRNYFNNLRSTFEMALMPKVNKGQLNQKRFDYIMSNIPTGDESHRAIIGKVQALSEALSQEGVKINTDILKSIPGFGSPTESKGYDVAQPKEKKNRPPLTSFYK